MKSWLILIAALAAFTGCRDKARESEVDDFARLYARLRVASSSREGHPEQARQAREDVLRKAGTDLAGYRRKLAELESDPNRWERFWSKVNAFSDTLSNQKRKGS